MALTPKDVLDREFLEIRAGILQVAAALDRIERSSPTTCDDPRLAQIRNGLELLLTEADDRAEQVQRAFSRPYDDAWRNSLKMPQ